MIRFRRIQSEWGLGAMYCAAVVALSSCTTPEPQPAYFGSMTRLSPGCKAAFERGETEYRGPDGVTRLCPLSKAPQWMRDQILGDEQ